MRLLATAAATALFAVSGAATAATFVAGAEGTTPAGEKIVANFDNLNPPIVLGGNGGQVFTGSVSGQGAAVNSTSYFAVFGGGTATYNFTTALSSISFDYGTPDDYNFFTVGFTDGTSQRFGAGGTPVTLGGDYRLQFNADAGQRISSFTFGSNTNSLEFDNVAINAVPEPEAWAMMIVGVGLVGAAARRRRCSAATVSFA